MTFVPASDPQDVWALLGGVAAVGGALQWWSHHEASDPGRIVARCADGSVIGERERAVRHRPPRRRRGAGRPPRGASAWPDREDLEAGDLSFLRIREGRSGEAEWVVEGLDSGAETFRLHWEFGSPDAAVEAHRLLRDRVVRAPLDASGSPVRLTDLEFDALWLGAPIESLPSAREITRDPGAPHPVS